MSERDRVFMKEAVRLALRGKGHTSPNPMVGAVVVKNDVIVGRGFHEYVGGPHAEVNALGQAGPEARGAELYVTLEPCNHHGRTPPCTQAVLRSGIARVVMGMLDPNPKVTGGGKDFLEKCGIQVETGILETECRRLNQAFIKHSTTGIPFVSLKVAATLDGRIATRTGDSRWISNEKSRLFVHHMRHASDAVLVGIGTAVRDDPELSVRLPGKKISREVVRIVLDSKLRLPPDSRLARTARDIPLWVVCTEAAPGEAERALVDKGATVLRVPERQGRIDLVSFLEECGRRDISSILVEGGGRVAGSFLEAGLVDDFYFFYAPKILSDPEGTPMISGLARLNMAEALPVYDLRVKRFGQDVLLTGRMRRDLY